MNMCVIMVCFFVRLKQGQNIQNIVHQYNGSAAVAGDYELLNLQLKLINDISGVNSAMQGQTPSSNTPSSLYAQQVQNSSMNVKGLLDSFRNFQRSETISNEDDSAILYFCSIYRPCRIGLFERSNGMIRKRCKIQK